MRFGRRGRTRRAPTTAAEGQAQPQTVVKMQELNKVLENEAATAEKIQAKLKELREARDKAKQQLAAAQQELRELLTARQEAQLVVMGMLE